ncbi:telomeric repeat-binding factor 2-interacting protein 1-like [Hydractinia symbiolongicarpus]|uniref:telomeric repeat-binding factor 2-interacting protein 1-like n=1 Tax=Hydractinia symbiolongicarpus TaxID=13093 RepID=UPI00254A7E7B|nr:telomeric repeat-binding factor 2-interacting protein 1-like [Hydractinia symbiolongicarpus]
MDDTDSKKPIFDQLKFLMRPGPNRAEIRKLIEENGGVLVSAIKEGVIRLTDDKLHLEGYHTDFIKESCKKQKLLDKTKYELPRYRSGTTSTTISIDRSLLTNARLKYQPEEDDAILCYVSKYARMSGCTGSLTGNLIWKKMQSEKVTLHSWQSMKDRYLKHLQHRVPSFDFQRITMRVCDGREIPFAVNTFDKPSFSPRKGKSTPIKEARKEISDPTDSVETESSIATESTGDVTLVRRKKRKMLPSNQPVFTASPRDSYGNPIDDIEKSSTCKGENKDLSTTMSTNKENNNNIDPSEDIDFFQTINSNENSMDTPNETIKNTVELHNSQLKTQPANKQNEELMTLLKDVTVVFNDVYSLSPTKSLKTEQTSEKKAEDKNEQHEAISPETNPRLSPKFCSTRVKGNTLVTNVRSSDSATRQLPVFDSSDEDDLFDKQLLRQAMMSSQNIKPILDENTASVNEQTGIGEDSHNHSAESCLAGNSSLSHNVENEIISVENIPPCECHRRPAYKRALQKVQEFDNLVREADPIFWTSLRGELLSIGVISK